MKIGNTDIANLKIGDVQVLKVYLGTVLVWEFANLINDFKTRVALEGGTFEAESCLETTLTNLNNID